MELEAAGGVPRPGGDGDGGPGRSSTVLASFANEVVGTMERISKLAENRASTYLYAVGTALMVYAFVMKVLASPKLEAASLSSGEFIAALVVGAVLLLVATVLRLSGDRKEAVAVSTVRDAGLKLIDRAFSVGEDLVDDAQVQQRTRRPLI